MQYTVDYFIEKFEKIPEEKWTTRLYRFGDSRCAAGHCLTDKMIDVLTEYFDEAGKNVFPKHKCIQYENELLEVRELGRVFHKNPSRGCDMVYEVNNGDNPNYQQPTPKQRILAALHDIKKLQNKMIEEPNDKRIVETTDASNNSAHKIKYVVVKVSESILEKEIFFS